jgi:hypothetical protein
MVEDLRPGISTCPGGERSGTPRPRPGPPAACSSQLHASLRSSLSSSSQVAIDSASGHHLTCPHLQSPTHSRQSPPVSRTGSDRRSPTFGYTYYCVACARSACASLAYRAGRHILQTCVTRLVTRYCSLPSAEPRLAALQRDTTAPATETPRL